MPNRKENDFGTALITGGGSGIGRATALMLSEKGASVVITDLDGAAARQVALEIEARGGRAMSFAMDVVDLARIEAVFTQVEQALGNVDIVVNSAGMLTVAPLLDMTAISFARVLEVNVTGSFMVSQRAARSMVKQGYGRIINLSSVSGQRAGAGRVAYGTSKSAIIGLTRQFALELGAAGITCNTIAPGVVQTPMTQGAYDEKTWEQVRGMIPSRRFGTPSDIADAITWLASPGASYINGETIFVDGGYIAGGMTQTGDIDLA